MTDQEVIDFLRSRYHTTAELKHYLRAVIFPAYGEIAAKEASTQKFRTEMDADVKRAVKGEKRIARWQDRNSRKAARLAKERAAALRTAKEMRENPELFKMPPPLITPEEAAQKIAAAKAAGLDIPEYRRNK
jgi:hypothetical protein